MLVFHIILLLCFGCIHCISAHFFDLAGSDWSVVSMNGGSVSSSCVLPNDVHTILTSIGFIEDPTYRFNDIEYRWIGEYDWVYTKRFDLTGLPQDGFEDFTSSANEELPDNVDAHFRVDCIDTFADIYINSVLIGSTENMFHQYIFEIPSGTLLLRDNKILIRIYSIIPIMQQKADDYPYSVPWSKQLPTVQEPPHRNFIRKNQMATGWDWGPAMLQSGIYGKIGIEFLEKDSVSITNAAASPKVSHSNSSCFDIDIHLSLTSSFSGSVRLLVTLDETPFYSISELSVTKGQADYTSILPDICNVELWWPNGMAEHGKPKLYPIRIDVSTLFGVSSKYFRIGFRKITMLESPVSTGKLFYFSVNDIPFYSKGANLIPISSFEGNISDSDVSRILNAAVLANHNTIRIWGGGLYQRSSFYDKADALGIMVWQEMMFACALYPTDSHFLTEVEAEVRYQMIRLMSHPSIMMWSANNENLGALDGWYVEARTHPQMYTVDYSKLYIETIAKIVISLDSTRPFWPSSPSNGMISNDPYVIDWENPGSPDIGDAHFYNYDDNCRDLSIFPRTRFASEFGFQSYCSMRSWHDAARLSDYNLSSPLMDHRQHHPGGNEQILAQIRRHFAISEAESAEGFEAFVFLSQSMQALCMDTETQFYRRLMGNDSIRNMGTLYWQLNDVHQAPTWSSIEYDGRWKMLHYVMKRSYEPVTCSISEDQFGSSNGIISFHLINDQDYQANVTNIKIDLFSWASGVVATILNPDPMIIPPFGVVEVFSQNTINLLGHSKACKNRVDCGTRMIATYNGRVIHAEYAIGSITTNSNLALNPVKIDSFACISSTECSFIAHATKPAAYLWFQLEESTEKSLLNDKCLVYFSDNAIVSFIGDAKFTVSIICQDIVRSISVDDIKSITISSLVDYINK